MGYLYMPEQTKAVIGDDGFMSTGDALVTIPVRRYPFLEYRVIYGP